VLVTGLTIVSSLSDFDVLRETVGVESIDVCLPLVIVVDILRTHDEGQAILLDVVADFPALEAKHHYPSAIFRGMKSDLYEGGHRIPLLARCPGLFGPNTVVDTPVSLVDLYATLARLFNIELSPDEAEDSFAWPYTNRPPIISQSIDGSLTIRSGNYKLLAAQGSGGWSEAADPSCEETLQLYDVDKDPHEDKNLIHDKPSLAQALLEQLATAVHEGSTHPSAHGNQDGPIPWPAIANWYNK